MFTCVMKVVPVDSPNHDGEWLEAKISREEKSHLANIGHTAFAYQWVDHHLAPNKYFTAQYSLRKYDHELNIVHNKFVAYTSYANCPDGEVVGSPRFTKPGAVNNLILALQGREDVSKFRSCNILMDNVTGDLNTWSTRWENLTKTRALGEITVLDTQLLHEKAKCLTCGGDCGQC